MPLSSDTYRRATLPFARRAAPGFAAILGALLVSVSACSHSMSQLPACGPTEKTVAQPSLRLLISFRADTLGDAPEVIEQLQSRVGACVRYVSSVSPTMHVYAVTGATDLQSVRDQILRWPAVSRVDADARLEQH